MIEQERKQKDAVLLGMVSILFLPIQYGLHGAVLSMLWLWFVVPLFHLPTITPLTGASLLVIIYFLEPTPVYEIVTWKMLGKGITNTISKAILYLAIGFVIHLLLGV